MRALLFAVILMLASPAFADAPPDRVDEADHLRLQMIDLQKVIVDLQAKLTSCQFQARYQIGDGDTFDPKTREIKRAKKPVKK